MPDNCHRLLQNRLFRHHKVANCKYRQVAVQRPALLFHPRIQQSEPLQKQKPKSAIAALLMSDGLYTGIYSFNQLQIKISVFMTLSGAVHSDRSSLNFQPFFNLFKFNIFFMHLLKISCTIKPAKYMITFQSGLFY